MIIWTELCSIVTFTGGWVGGWVGGVDELTLKLTSASTRVGVEVGLSLAKIRFGFYRSKHKGRTVIAARNEKT